jgi:hypothetical protein
MTIYDGFVERRILAGTDHGVFRGVRLAVKDNIPVEGFRFTAGHPLFADRRAPHSAPAVQLLTLMPARPPRDVYRRWRLRRNDAMCAQSDLQRLDHCD